MPGQDKKEEMITQSLCISTLCTIVIIVTIALQWIIKNVAVQWENVFDATFWANIAFLAAVFFILNGLNDKFKVINKFRKWIHHTN